MSERTPPRQGWPRAAASRSPEANGVTPDMKPGPIDSVDALLGWLRALELLTPLQWQELPALLGECSQPRALARELLQREWLTPYQLNQLFQGRGQDLLVGGKEQTGSARVRLFTTRNRKLLRTLPGDTALGGFGEAGKVLLVGGNTLRLFDVQTGKEENPVRGHTGPVLDLAFGPEGSFLLSVGEDQLRLWEGAEFTEKKRFPPTTAASLVSLSPDGQRVLTLKGPLAPEEPATLWELASGRQLGTLGQPGQRLSAGGFLTDQRIFTAGGDGMVRLWDQNLREVLALQTGGEVSSAVPLFEERLLCLNGGVVHDWHLGQKQVLRAWGDRITRLGVVRGRGRIYFGKSDGNLGALNVQGDTSTTDLFVRWHSAAITALALSSQGTRLASADAAGRVVLWDLTAPPLQRRLAEWVQPENVVQALAFSPDGQRLALANSNTTIYLLRWPTQRHDPP
jgi:WD40 repeat protein